MKALACFLVLLLFALPLGVLASEGDEPEPTPVIEAPEPPPLAIGGQDNGDGGDEGENGRFPIPLFALIIVVLSAIFIALVFLVFALVRRALAKKKEAQPTRQSFP